MRRLWRHWESRMAASAAAALCLALLALPAAPDARAEPERTGSSLLERARATYDFHCATCHGTTGGGLEEARRRFPDDHAYCERCHVPLNRPQMSQREIEAMQTVFSLGQPPRLDDAASLAKFRTAGALERYVQVTMPRWNPAGLDDEAYRLATLFVLHLSGLIDLARDDALPHDLDQLELEPAAGP